MTIDTSLTRLAAHIHEAPVRHHDGLHITQAEAETLHIVEVACVYPVKFVENMLAGLLADAHAANELIEAALIDGPPVDVHRLAAICGILVLTRKFPDVLSGLILELDHGAIVGINSRHASVRQRFSVGHELGHHLLRHADRFHIDVSDGASPDHDYASERAANEFAAELLMPRRFVARAFHENPNPSSLADLFEVSAIAMGYRLVNLGLR
jgi:hypothetical protein